jgi:adenine deaminase
MSHIEYLKKAKNQDKPQLVLKDVNLVNVYTKAIEKTDIAIEGGIILGIGHYDGINEINCEGYYAAPGFIDGHVHIESSMLTPPGFAKLVLPFGTTSVIADPHEIANVSGIKGISFMLDASEDIPLNVYMMIPSCVPATSFENSGATITKADILSLKNHPRVIGLGEVMDYPSVISGDPMIHEKIDVMKNRIIDGHAPDVMGYDLKAYLLSGIMTDHECTIKESMIERIQQGMYVIIREGSATRNTQTLLKGLKPAHYHRTLFCTDDKHPEDILKEGHINFNVNLAIASGIDPIEAISMATLNAATCYRLYHLGAISAGKQADIILFKDLKNIQPDYVYHQGVLVSKNKQTTFEIEKPNTKNVTHTVLFDIKDLSFDLEITSNPVRVIGLIEDNITTESLKMDVTIKNGKFVFDDQLDVLKLAVIERHHMRKSIGLGLVKGFGIKRGAIATTIGHDSHNLIILGTNDEDMMLAAKKILEIQGGIVLVDQQKVIDTLPLEISGIMTLTDAKIVEEKLKNMKAHIKTMGLSPKVNDPFTTLSFLALPVIPKLKLTDQGLFDVDTFEFVSIEVDK